MTTADTTGRVKAPQADNPFRLPDPPEREPEDMTSAKHLAETGNMHHLKLHLGNPETTIVKSELYLALGRRGSGAEFRVPDLLIAFEANPELYERNNGYVVSEQGKPPEFVLEIASPSTRAEDNAGKRDFYARHEVVEYWRFDEEDRPNRVRLAGDRLAGGHYEPIAVEELDDGVLQGYSAALNLHLRWEQGELRWHDPATGRHILTYDDQRARADNAQSLAETERAARMEAAARAEAAEARAEAAEAELRRRREG